MTAGNDAQRQVDRELRLIIAAADPDAKWLRPWSWRVVRARLRIAVSNIARRERGGR